MPRPAAHRRTPFRPMLGLAVLISLGSHDAAFAQVSPYAFEIVPVQPLAQESVYIRIALPDCTSVERIRHVDGAIQVGIEETGCALPEPALRVHEASLGRFPQGTYRVRLDLPANASTPSAGLEQTLTVVEPEHDNWGPVIALDYSGWWTTADGDRGEGWLVEHRMPHRLILSWVTYDTDGNPNWFNMQSTGTGSSVTGPVYRSRREGDTVVRSHIGQGWFHARSATEAQFDLEPVGMPGQHITTPLRRMPF